MNKPWLTWPHELPAARDAFLGQTASHKFLTNDAFFRDMTAEIRQQLVRSMQQALQPQGEASAQDALLRAIQHAIAPEADGIKGSMILLKGGTDNEFAFYDTDTTKTEFRQELFFQYLFGVNEPDLYGAIDVESGESFLFVPVTPAEWERWNGPTRPMDYYVEKYGVTAAHPVNDMDAFLRKRGVTKLFTLYGQNTDSGEFTKTIPDFEGINHYKQDKTLLHPLLAEQRVFKTDAEAALLRVAVLISSQAHVFVMRHIKPGMTELQLEALYKSWCQYFGASRHMAYTCICGSGSNGSILHYGHAGRPNDRILQAGDTVVLDMGAEYRGYATDLTRSYVVGGKFSPDQLLIHDAVREAQAAVIAAMKPGVSWVDMHRLAERVILSHLLKGGILQNGTVDELQAAHIGAVFMPHGLGHLLGLAVHDVGGYPVHAPPRREEPGVCYLRTARDLEKGMFLTVEPGCYFNDSLLDKALANPEQGKYINAEVLKRFRGTGGVRFEDDVLVTEDGVENLTQIPWTAADIEEVIRDAQTPGVAGASAAAGASACDLPMH